MDAYLWLHSNSYHISREHDIRRGRTTQPCKGGSQCPGAAECAAHDRHAGAPRPTSTMLKYLHHSTCQAGCRTACCHQPAGHGAAHLQHAQRRRLHMRSITAIFDVLQWSDVVSGSLLICLCAYVRTI